MKNPFEDEGKCNNDTTNHRDCPCWCLIKLSSSWSTTTTTRHLLSFFPILPHKNPKKKKKKSNPQLLLLLLMYCITVFKLFQESIVKEKAGEMMEIFFFYPLFGLTFFVYLFVIVTEKCTERIIRPLLWLKVLPIFLGTKNC